MKIFTGAITNWDDKAITKDYGAQLPNLPITPVIRSDGSGATYFFTRWMAHMFPSEWNAFCQKAHPHPAIHLPCGQTEFYPLFKGAKSENGSNNVATYITASYGNGAIGYDEYAYALNSHYPVVKLLNPAGYYVLPTASNVAVALTKAVINENASSPDFLQQNLDSVYTFTDPRSYPLSSYSYLIVPRAGTHQPTNFTPGQGQDAEHVRQLLPVRGTEGGGRARLLTAAAEPGPGRPAAELQDPRRRRGAESDHAGRLRQPHLHQRQAHAAASPPRSPRRATRSASR